VDTYIVRIYRREEGDSQTLAGTVEEPGVPERRTFVNLGQLWDILNLKSKSKPEKKIKDKEKCRERTRSR
jgi:hypothetical protein